MLNEITLISNNYGKNYDGIGSFAKVVFSKFPNYGCNVKVLSAELYDSNYLTKLFCSKMTSILKTLIRNIQNDNCKTQAIIIEYPFIECNIKLISSYKKLSHLCKKNNIPLILSLHEYARTNFIRRFIIRSLVKNSDILFATNDEIIKSLPCKPKYVYLRNIPSNIDYIPSSNIKENKNFNDYVFFGLINKTKAFDEMILGWKTFYKNKNDKNLKLHIISASKFDDNEIESLKKFNIILHYNLSDKEINSILDKCSFGVLPIKPYIDEKNTTFKTMLFNSVYCIGKFKNEFIKKNNLQVENIEELIPDSFSTAFNNCYNYKKTDLKVMVDGNQKIALKHFSAEGVSIDYYDKIKEGVETYEREK